MLINTLNQLYEITVILLCLIYHGVGIGFFGGKKTISTESKKKTLENKKNIKKNFAEDSKYCIYPFQSFWVLWEKKKLKF